MPFKWFLISLSSVVAAAAAYSVMVLVARPAPAHSFFAADGRTTQTIAHRGGSQLWPENTLVAFVHAAEIGADVLETDVRATADGAIVCLHDATVDRTTDGAGRVDAMQLTQLRKLDAGHRWSDDGGRTFPFRGKGIAVPTLEEVFARIPGKRMNVEIKQPEAGFARSLCALIRRAGMTEKVLVASINVDALAAFREACPEVATSMSSPEARLFVGLSRARLSAAYSPPVAALQIPDRLGEAVIPTAALVADAHRRNLKVHVWTVNDEARMKQLIQIGVDGIITDRPDLTLRLHPSAPR